MKNNSKNPASNATSPAPKKGKKGFQKGESGNLDGRPKGSESLRTRLARKLLGENAEELLLVVIEKAKAGDLTALRLCLERILPPVRSTTVSILLPSIEGPQDIPKCYDVLFDSLKREEITLDEFLRISGVLENRRKAFETTLLIEEIERIKDYLELNR